MPPSTTATSPSSERSSPGRWSTTTVTDRPAVGPAWLAASLRAGSIVEASRLGWGFRNETWRVDLVDGRRIAVTRFADAANTGVVVDRIVRLGPRLRSAGIPVPRAVDPGWVADRHLLATDFVEGLA